MNMIFVILLFFSVVLHEVAHGYTAYKLGDKTAKELGRLTFNPLPHIDILGTIVLPAFLIITSAPVILAWAKPVPVNPYNFKRPRRDMLWVALAGPLSNLALAVIVSILLKLNIFPSFHHILVALGFLNIILAIFNLLPIPPLDGSRIAAGIMPHRWSYKYMQIEPFGFIIIFTLLFFGFFKVIFNIAGIISYALGIKIL
ncbi:MAG: site-2 protease family protein [Candidatus Omnitrophica bacterium]|nr:site-2 protease family protein [Candidatus Omnitrophota bacterium]